MKKLKLHRRTGRPLVYKTQVDLARLIVKELKLPENMNLRRVIAPFFPSSAEAVGVIFSRPSRTPRRPIGRRRSEPLPQASLPPLFRTLLFQRGGEVYRGRLPLFDGHVLYLPGELDHRDALRPGA